jgi:hypothetical protein
VPARHQRVFRRTARSPHPCGRTYDHDAGRQMPPILAFVLGSHGPAPGRKCGKTPRHPGRPWRSLAHTAADAMRVGRVAIKRNLSASPVFPPQGTPGSQEGRDRDRTFDPHCRLPYAEKPRAISRTRLGPLRQTRSSPDRCQSLPNASRISEMTFNIASPPDQNSRSPNPRRRRSVWRAAAGLFCTNKPSDLGELVRIAARSLSSRAQT